MNFHWFLTMTIPLVVNYGAMVVNNSPLIVNHSMVVVNGSNYGC